MSLESPSGDAPSPEQLAGLFALFGPRLPTRTPFYSRLCTTIGEHPEVAALLGSAPPEQHNPVLLLAAVHYLVLEDPGQELAAWYPSVTTEPRTDDPFPAFAAVCAARESDIRRLVATRFTQTNEVGRCAVFLPAFGLLADEVGPLAHLDVGASAGLNLQFDRYSYEYEPGGPVGGPSTVHLAAGTRGPVPVPRAIPLVSGRLGIDQNPLDVGDPDQARWLKACVWPDQEDRFTRLAAAIEIAQAHPVEVSTGDAVDGLASAADRVVSAGGHLVVTNSWVLNYLPAERRHAYVAELDQIGATVDVSWLLAESPALCPELPFGLGPDAGDVDIERTVLSMVRWRGGERTAVALAECHPHGYWLHWLSPGG